DLALVVGQLAPVVLAANEQVAFGGRLPGAGGAQLERFAELEIVEQNADKLARACGIAIGVGWQTLSAGLPGSRCREAVLGSRFRHDGRSLPAALSLNLRGARAARQHDRRLLFPFPAAKIDAKTLAQMLVEKTVFERDLVRQVAIHLLE